MSHTSTSQRRSASIVASGMSSPDISYSCTAGVQNVLAETADAPRDDYDRVMAINLRACGAA
jgi:NAD(P)-dependent dehydrogenase (short-subunit alcohol dehydrogenase family)